MAQTLKEYRVKDNKVEDVALLNGMNLNDRVEKGMLIKVIEKKGPFIFKKYEFLFELMNLTLSFFNLLYTIDFQLYIIFLNYYNMQKNYCFFLLCLISTTSFGQLAKNSVYLELGGSGLGYSLNYERSLVDTQWFRLLPSAGATSNFDNYLAFPVEVHLLFGASKHFIETGVGITNILSLKSPLNVDIHPGPRTIEYDKHFSGRLGYRYVSESGLLFKLAWVPILEENKIYQWAGLSIGTNF